LVVCFTDWPVRFAETWLNILFWLKCCDRKTLFWLKKEAEQVRFKVSRTDPLQSAVAGLQHGRVQLRRRLLLARSFQAHCTLIFI